MNPRSIPNQNDSQFIQSIIDEILATTTIPALDPDQMAILTQHLYNLSTKGELRYLRTDIAEIAYRRQSTNSREESARWRRCPKPGAA